MAGVTAPPDRPMLGGFLTRATGTGPGTGSRRARPAGDRRGLLFVAPFILFFLAFMLAPVGYAIYTSLFTTQAHRRDQVFLAGELRPGADLR